MALPILTIAGTLKNVPKNVNRNETMNQDAINTIVITIARTSIVNINAIEVSFLIFLYKER